MKPRVWYTMILLVVACQGKPPMPPPGGSPTAPPQAGNPATVGTRGGGTGLVFNFKQGALSALKVVRSKKSISFYNDESAMIEKFYATHRERLIENLELFADGKNIVFETGKKLAERGSPVGALSNPAENPEKVLLSVPFLTGPDGFTERKAFGLAFHEAWHFTYPQMTEAEHTYIDQMGSQLYAFKSQVMPLKDEYFFSLNPFWQPQTVTSDASVMVLFQPRTKEEVEKLILVNLKTGKIYVENIADFRQDLKLFENNLIKILDQDLLWHQLGSNKFEIRNLMTQQRWNFNLDGIIKDVKYFSDTRLLVVKLEDKIVHIDLRTDQVRYLRNIITTGFRKIQEVFSSDGILQAQSPNPQAHGAADKIIVKNTVTEEILDFIRPEDENNLLRPFGFSQNNTELVFGEFQRFHQGVGSGIFIRNILTGKNKVYPHYRNVEFSPDRQKILLTKVNVVSDPVIVFNLNTKVEQRLTLNLQKNGSINWISNDSRHIVFVTDSNEIVVLNIKTLEEEMRFQGMAETAVEAFSTSQGIAFITFKAGKTWIYFKRFLIQGG